MEIFYAISPYPSLTENMVAKVYETQSPNAEVASQVIPSPHTNPVNISFTGLDLVPHIVRLFTASGTLLHYYDVQPTANVVTVFLPVFFKIGDGGAQTPLAGSAIYVNINLVNLTNADLIIHRDGIAQYPGRHYDVDSSGGFHLLIAGDQFEDTVEWVVQQNTKVIVTPINDSVVGKQFGGFVTVNNTVVSYIPAHLRKLIRLSGANGQYIFPAGTAIPIGYVFRVTNFGAYAAITDTPTIFFNNAPLLMGNTVATSFILPFKSTAEFCFDGTNWNCTLNTISATAAFGRIVHMGRVTFGDVVSQYSQFVNIPSQPDNNYWVIGSLVGLNTNIDADNDVFATYTHLTATGFTFVVREVQPIVQNLRLDFVIMRAN